jgi:integrase
VSRPQRWTDEWVKSLEHPGPGEPEKPFYDPSLNGHRLIVSRTRKVFEIQAQQPAKFRVNGKRRTFKVQIGDVLDTTIEQARERAAVMLARIRKGEDPRASAPARSAETTLGSAWKEFKARPDLGERTLEMYDGHYERNLKKWADVTLQTLAMNPRMARDEHKRITERPAPSEADHAMRLLRSIFRYAAKEDPSLDIDVKRGRHPCTSVEWNGDNKRMNAAIPREQMPAWKKQVEALRSESPLRASFQVLLLRLGCRPGELASAEWSQVEWNRKVFWIPESKTEAYEIPLTKHCIAEFKKLEEARALNRDGNDFIFPSRSESGHIEQFIEPKTVLSHCSNQMRHTHHTIGVRLKVDDRILDPLEGRSLIKRGLAGRGYIDLHELGPELRAAQEIINHEIDRLLKGT